MNKTDLLERELRHGRRTVFEDTAATLRLLVRRALVLCHAMLELDPGCRMRLV